MPADRSAAKCSRCGLTNCSCVGGHGGPLRPTPSAAQGQDDALPVLGGHAASKHLMACEREMEEVLSQGRGDVEGVHYDADQILCRALKLLGYRKLVALYDDVPKWYA